MIGIFNRKKRNKYGIIIIIIITKIIFKPMNLNSGIFLDWKLNLEVKFLKNWTLIIGIFK